MQKHDRPYSCFTMFEGKHMLGTKLLEDVIEAAPNRRRFLNKIALGTAALSAMGGSASRALGQASGPTDADILNFALNLEYL